MRAPLSVRINDGKVDRPVTKAVRGLRFRKTAPGGYAAASMQLLLPRNTFTDLGAADKVYIYDGRNGQTLWEGFTENPGTMDGPGGQGFDLSALGTTILASDQSRAYFWRDTDLTRWVRSPGSAASAGAASAENPSNGDLGLLCQFNPGQAITTGDVAQIKYHALFESGCGMEFGAIRVTTDGGKTDSGYLTDLLFGDNSTTTVIFIGNGATLTTTAVVNQERWVGVASQITTGQNRIALRLRRAGGATNVADDNTWAHFSAIAILGRRADRFGTLVTGTAGMQSTAYVLASWAVEDMVGRTLTFVDPNLAQIDTTTTQIDQLAYPDGAKASQILDDLSLWEPNFLWELLESGPRGYRFNYRAWPTNARYEISIKDGYNAPGADVDLCNRIAVAWTDSRGNQQVTIRGASVPALGNGSPVLADGSRDPAYTGRVRDADQITLPDGQGSLANAQRIGDQELASKANPPKAATAVVRRQIFDQLTGNWVYPWEIEPGYVVRVRETNDMLRLTEMEYVDDDCAATLTLGEPQLTQEQRLARLSRKVA